MSASLFFVAIWCLARGKKTWNTIRYVFHALWLYDEAKKEQTKQREQSFVGIYSENEYEFSMPMTT